MMIRNRISAALCALALLCCTACGSTSLPAPEEEKEMLLRSPEPSASVGNTSGQFTDRDFENSAEGAQTLTLSDETGSITISEPGTYRLTGSLTDGQIIVSIPETEKAQLLLDGVSVTKNGGAALYIPSGDKVFLTAAEGSENTLQSAGELSEEADGAVFARSDLTLNGLGSLTVTCESGHGIVCKDDLKITSGVLTVTAAKKGISANDSIRIADGAVTVTSGKDGLHAENTESAEKGYVWLGGGTLTVTAGQDGISASSDLTVEGGSITLKTGGGSEAAPAHAGEGFGSMFGGRGGFDRFGSFGTQTQTDTPSAKGLKAGGSLLVCGGTIDVDSCDDALHSNAALTVSDGILTLASGDDGIHADGDLLLSGGTLTVSRSYEGLEGAAITVNGGTLNITASDDGMNANGSGSETGMGGMFGGRGGFEASSSAALTVNGGHITVNAGGDGLDSNGSLTVTGGEIYVCGPTDSGNGALDSGSTPVITGGTVIAVGSVGMAVCFGSGSAQGSAMVNVSGQAGTAITLTDESGKVLASYTPVKSFQNIVISAPGMTENGTYTLTVGTQVKTFSLSGLFYSENGMGGFGGRGGQGFDPGRTPGEMPTMPGGEAPTVPGGEMPSFPGGGERQPGGNRPPDAELPPQPVIPTFRA